MQLDYKGISVHYQLEGKGTTVVLLHGFLENLSMWKDIKENLIARYRVLAIDLLGHGKTPCLGYVHSMKDQANLLEAILKKHRIRKPILIGHSMGGYVALAYVEKYPDNIKGLCLMNSTSLADDDERKELRAKANKMVQTNFKSMVTISFTNLFGSESKTIFKNEIELALQEALKTPVQGYIACMEGMRIRPNRINVLKILQCPKLLIVGKKDPVLNFENSLQEAKNTKSEIVVFPDGHMSHIENKKTLTVALQQFVKSC